MGQSKKTILDGIALCRAKIERREAQRAELERLKKHVKPETYKRVLRDITEENKTSRKTQKRIEAIIEKHPHELQRKILYCKWVQGMKLQDIADELAYSENHIAREHGRAMKTINEKYPPE